MGKEIERTWVLLGDPTDHGCIERQTKEILQGYLSPADSSIEARVRRVGPEPIRHKLTFKKSSGLNREEVEHEIGEDHFNELLDICLDTIEKTRVEYHTPEAPNLIEVDYYDGGLVLGEIEFPDNQAAEEYKAPEWFGTEVTYDPRFANRHIAKHGPAEFSDYNLDRCPQ